MNCVIDASVAIKWYVPEVYEQEATKLKKTGGIFHAPELILPEFGNIIWKKVIRKELTDKEGQGIIAAFAAEKLVLHSHQATLISSYIGADTTGQTVYDWTYLALAIAISCPFVTADEKFYKALEPTPLKAHLIWIGDIS